MNIIFKTFFLFFTIPTIVFSQGENNQWYLNAATFLDFNNTPPSLVEA